MWPIGVCTNWVCVRIGPVRPKRGSPAERLVCFARAGGCLRLCGWASARLFISARTPNWPIDHRAHCVSIPKPLAWGARRMGVSSVKFSRKTDDSMAGCETAKIARQTRCPPARAKTTRRYCEDSWLCDLVRRSRNEVIPLSE